MNATGPPLAMIDFANVPPGALPMVSVCMVTYEHEAFIRQAIESVLMQQTDFPVELLVGEDCSPDRTREIVLELEQKYPDRIRVSAHTANLGAQMNFIETLRACRGKYVAWLDGDDYWQSPDKLQKQVDLMESRPDLSICFHAARVLIETTGREFIATPPGRAATYTRDALARSSMIPTSSALFRNHLLAELPDWFWGVPYGDWSIFALLTEHGDIGYIDEPMSVQRRHEGGIFAENRDDKIRLGKVVMRMQRIFIEHFAPPDNTAFRRGLYASYYWLAHAYMDQGRRDRARLYLCRCLRGCGYDPSVSKTEPFKTFLHLLAPGLYRRLRGGEA